MTATRASIRPQVAPSGPSNAESPNGKRQHRNAHQPETRRSTRAARDRRHARSPRSGGTAYDEADEIRLALLEESQLGGRRTARARVACRSWRLAGPRQAAASWSAVGGEPQTTEPGTIALMAFRAMPYAGAHGALTTLPVPAHPARRSRPAREANCSWLSVRAARRGPSGVCGVWDVWMGVDTCRHPWQTRPCAGDHQPMPAARELVGKRRTSIVRFGSVATDAESELRDSGMRPARATKK